MSVENRRMPLNTGSSSMKDIEKALHSVKLEDSKKCTLVQFTARPQSLVELKVENYSNDFKQIITEYFHFYKDTCEMYRVATAERGAFNE